MYSSDADIHTQQDQQINTCNTKLIYKCIYQIWQILWQAEAEMSLTLYATLLGVRSIFFRKGSGSA